MSDDTKDTTGAVEGDEACAPAEVVATAIERAEALGGAYLSNVVTRVELVEAVGDVLRDLLKQGATELELLAVAVTAESAAREHVGALWTAWAPDCSRCA